MPSFSVDKYNQLLSISDAHSVLSKQLASANMRLRNLLTDRETVQLFAEGTYACQFGICILHRHFTLKQGERMVSRDEKDGDASITEPELEEGSMNVYADRWYPDGDEFEHRVLTSGQPIDPPSPTFFAEFRRICVRFNVNILGICRAEPYVVTLADCVFLEEIDGNPANRRQRTTFVPRASISSQTVLRQSAWMPVRMDDENIALYCTCNCTGHLEPVYPAPVYPAVETHVFDDDDAPPKPSKTSTPYRFHYANHI